MRELSDDEVFGQTGKQELSDDEVFGTTPATAQPKGFFSQLMQDIKGALAPKKSVLETEPAQPNPDFNFATASRVARAVDDGVPLALPRTIAGDQEAVAAAAAQETERRAGMGRRRFANENPVLAGAASGSAQALSGLANAPFVAADLFNKVAVNPVLGLVGADPLQPGQAPGTETLRKLTQDYAPAVAKPGLSEAWEGDQFGTWLMANLAQQLPQMSQSLTAAFAPATRPFLLPSMGAQAAGSSYVQGDDSRIAAAKGLLEVGTEMLPLGAFDRVTAALGGLPGDAQRSVMATAGRKLMAAGGALTANGVTGAIEEAIAQVGGNALDKFVAGKNVGLLDDADKSAVLGAAGGSLLSAPQVAGTLLPEKKEPQPPSPTLADYQAAAARVFGQPQARAPQPPPAAPAAPDATPAAPAPAAPTPGIDQPTLANILGAIEKAASVNQAPAAPQAQAQTSELTDEEVMGAQAPDALPSIGQAVATAAAPQQPAEAQPSGTDYALPADRIDSQHQPGAEVQQPAPAVGATMEGAGASQPPQAATQQDDGPVGMDFTPMSQGGRPFKTDREAKAARKLQPHLRVKKAPDGKGYILTPASPAQLAAAAQAAKRISGARTGNAGKPMSAHEFIIGKGGLHQGAMPDTGFDRNPRFGNRTLFAGRGKQGLTLAQAAELLHEAGYIQDESERAAADIIKRSTTSPQYTAEGWERIAQAEQDTRFEDHLAAQQEQPSDPFGMLDEQDLADTGYTQASPELQAEVRALRELAEQQGVDDESIMSDLARQLPNATEQEYYEAAKSALTAAVQEAQPRGNRAGGQDDGARAGQQAEGQGDTDQSLTAPSQADVLAQQERADNAAERDQREQVRKESEAGAGQFSLTQEDGRQDSTGDLFGTPAAEVDHAQESVDDLRKQLREIEDRMVGAAGLAPGFIEDAARSRKVPAEMKVRRDELRQRIRDLQGKVDVARTEPADEKPAAQMSAAELLRMAADKMEGKAPSKATKPAKASQSDAAAGKSPASSIADFGEKIGGAKKDTWTSFKDDLGKVGDDDIISQPLSKIWPAPDYQALIDGGMDGWAVAFAHAARDEIPNKPRDGWKAKRWAEQVKLLRGTALKLMDGSLSVERAKQFMTEFSSKGMQDLAGRIDLYILVGHAKSLDGVRISHGQYSIHNGIEYNPARTIWTVEKKAAATAFSNWPRELATGSTRAEALQNFKDRFDSIDINPAKSKEVSFDIYSYSNANGYLIGKKVGRNHIKLAGPFDTVKAAREYRANNQAELVDKLAKSKEIPSERRDTNNPRVGEDMRMGQDVTPAMFGEAFGFRGVEFGNWVEQKKRQKDLNDAYDALMDMAAILGVNPKALSLNGELGLAFGARGGGGVNPAAAHYESDKVVINLTKKEGAGSLGHEWWHALDNYFSRMRAKGGDYMTAALDVSLASRGSAYHHAGAVRKEMVDAFGEVMKSIKQTAIKARSVKLDSKRTKEYWTTSIEMSARAFESYLISKLQDQGASNDYLANIVDDATWKAAEGLGFELDDSYPYPTAGEIPVIRAGFDNFFQAVQTRETEHGVAMFSTDSDKMARQTGGVHMKDAKAVVAGIRQALPKAPAIHLHESISKAPQSLIEAIRNAGVESSVEAAYHEGEIHVFPDNIASIERMQFVVGHHEIRHHGLRAMLGPRLGQVMLALYSNPSLKAAADAKIGEGHVTNRVMAVEEALADMPVEEVAKLKGFDQLVAAIRQWLRQIAGRLRDAGMTALADSIEPAQWTDKDVAALVAKAEDASRNGSGEFRAGGTVFSDDPTTQESGGAQTEAPDASIVREDGPEYGDQPELALGSADPDKFKLKDLLGFERDASGRRIWTAGRKGYDAGMDLARSVLGKAKLMDTKPGEFRTMMRKFQADNYNAQQRALEIAKAGQGVPPEMRRLLSDIIEKEVAVGDNTPDGLLEIAASMSASFERQAQELIELGMMSPDRKVADYLPRVYRNPLIGKLQSREQIMGMLTKVRMKIKGDRLKSRGLTTLVSPGRVKDIERLGWKLSSMPDGQPVPVDLRSAIEKGKPMPGRFNEGQKVLMWRDFTKTEREEMGEVRDAFIRFAMGYVETQKDLATGRLFKAISEDRNLSSMHNPGGWVKIPSKEVFGSGLKLYGALSGMYVEPQVADQLKRAIQDNSAVLQAYDKAMSLWKEGKTVWNPVAHGNNIVSNLFMAHFAGINFANPKVWRQALKEYRAKGELYQEAVEHGLLGTEFANAEIQQALMPELQEFMSEADVVASRVTKMAEFLKKTGKPVAWYREKMQKAYEFEDQIFKLMVFIDRRQNGATPDAAVDDAERYFFNYSDVPEGIRTVQRFWSPFFSYTYKALPAVLHTAATRPDRLVMPMLLLGGMNWLAYAMLGDDGDEDKERKNLPDYMKGNTALGSPKMVRLPANSPEGNPYFLDMSRRIPLGDIFDLNNQMGGLSVLQPFMPSHPILWSVPLAILGNKDNFTGRELVKKSDTEWEAAEKRAGYLYRQVVPNAAFVPGSYAWDKSLNGLASTFDKDILGYTGFSNQGDKTKPLVAALDVTGVAKVRESNTKRNESFKLMDLRKESQEIRANMVSLSRSHRNGAITQEAYDKQAALQREKMERLRERMSEVRD